MLETNASDGVVASVLSQKYTGDQSPVTFFTKTMALTELYYDTHDKEMLEIVCSFGQWRAELISTPQYIRIVTNHKALEYLIITKPLNSCQARQTEVLVDLGLWNM